MIDLSMSLLYFAKSFPSLDIGFEIELEVMDRFGDFLGFGRNALSVESLLLKQIQEKKRLHVEVFG
jgi:hypothetical protein